MFTFRRWVRLLPLALVALLIAGTGWGTALAQDVATLEEIASETAAVRELPPVSELDPVFLTAAEAQADIEAMLLEEWDQDGAEAAVRSAAALGILPAETDLLALYIDLLGEQAGGYYDPETGRLVVVQGQGFGPVEQFAFSHEVVHALQDAHLGLDALMDDLEDVTDDEILATMALYEGDATLASILYISTKPMLAMQLAAESFTAGDIDTAVLDAAPPLMSLGLVFPYLNGLEFVQALYEDGGWAAVDAAYASPPVSTEQILHLEKYLAGEEPVALTLPDPASTLGDGWEMIDDNSLGEFQIAVMLANLAPGEGINDFTGTIDLPAAATNAAAGWDGDRYQFWVNGDEEAFLWQSVWESERDALAFFAAMRAYDEGRFSSQFTAAAPEDATLETDGPVVRLVREGTTVNYVQAATVELADQVLAGLDEVAVDEAA